MAALSRAKITGLKQLAQQIQDLTTKQQRTARRVAVRAAAKMIADAAKSLVAVDEGDLQRGIAFNVKVTKNAEGANIGYKREVYWGLFNELGTAKMRARPFLRPALVAKQAAALHKFAEVFKAMVAKYRGK